MPPAQPASEPQATPSSPQESLSQFVARILDQLSVSAWLPSAALVFSLLLIGNLREANGDLREALATIGTIDLGPALALIGAVIVATVLTQAFEFEAIRLLEGYWGPGQIRGAVSDLLARWHLWRRNALKRRRDALTKQAFRIAREAMLEKPNIGREVVAVIEERRLGHSVAFASAEARQKAALLNWLDFADPDDRRRLDAVVAALSTYPIRDHAMRPTRLGNTLKAYEERVHDLGIGPLEHFVQEQFDRLPPSLQVTHDQFRSRLDLYCALVAVFALCGVLGVVVLWSVGSETVIWTVACTVILMLISYRAAIASARGYGGVLLTIAAFTRPG